MTDVAFFASPIGLGHVARDAAIADRFENTAVRFVTGGSAAKFLAMHGLDVSDMYKPPGFDVRDGVLHGRLGWLWRYYKYYKECRRAASKAIKEMNPSMVVSDEDFASLSVAQESSIPSVLITDILETRFTSRIGGFVEKKMNRAMQKIIERCNTVIIPECGDDEGNIKRVGPITRQTKFSREQLRDRFKFYKKTVLVSVGGTDAGRFLIEKALQIVPDLGSDVEVVLVPGPSIPDRFTKVRNLGFVDNLHELVFASDVVVSLAGRSTMDEAAAYGTPGIFIPIKNHFEQEDNARRAGFSHKDIDKLADLVREKLEQKRSLAISDGAQKTAEILRLLHESNA